MKQISNLVRNVLLCSLLLAGCGRDARDSGTEGPHASHEAASEREIIRTDRAPAAIGPYSQAVLVGNFLYLAGQIALNPETGEMVEGGVEEQTHQVMQNLRAVLEAAGYSFADVVQAQVFVADMNDYGTINGVYARYMGASPPARAVVEVQRLPRDALLEIMMVAAK